MSPYLYYDEVHESDVQVAHLERQQATGMGKSDPATVCDLKKRKQLPYTRHKLYRIKNLFKNVTFIMLLSTEVMSDSPSRRAAYHEDG